MTAGQYCQFLNAVATTSDPYGLYNTGMWSDPRSCQIQRVGSPGNYAYQVGADHADRPVDNVCLWDSYRFANWLSNGQPAGPVGPGTTETGMYTLSGYNGLDGSWIIRNAGATWAVTTDNEWYKAAYYDPNKPGGADYWKFPTRSDTAPGQDMSEATNPGNNANYSTMTSPYPIDSAGYWTTNVGQFSLSSSAYGTFDQAGNVIELIATVIQTNPVEAGYAERGGCFSSGTETLQPGFWDVQLPTDEGTGLGFRVVQVPEPATMVLLGLGSLTTWRRATIQHTRTIGSREN